MKHRFEIEDCSSVETTGFTEPLHAKKHLRCVSTEDCPILGAGRSATVYWLDPETVVKKYDARVPLEMIRREMELSGKAFAFGIPTPTPFELVRADDSYGVVFEQIAPAVTVGSAITAHPERFDELTGKFTALLKQIHHTCVPEKDEFPSEKDHWLSWAEGMRPYYSEDETGLLLKMLQGIPERSTIVHCDFHENNVMVRGDELILIDMSDIGRGHPIFDLASGAFRAHVSRIPGRQAHHGLPAEMMERFWDTVLRMYFETEDPEKIKKLQDMCLAFGLVRSALFPMKHVQIGEKLRQIHIDDARRNLFPRKEWALQQMESLNVVLPEVQA